MVTFSNDCDILKYEPILFGQLHLSGQVLTSGTGGTLTGTTFAADGADFVGSQIAAGGVVYLQSADGTLDGAAEIVSVDSATELTVSVIRADSSQEAIAPPAASDVTYRISTFKPQAAEIAFELTEHFGIAPGNPASDIDQSDILDTSVLRQASVFAVISGVYAMLASKDDNENFWKKSLYYNKLSQKARQRCRLCIDISGDGLVDFTKLGGCANLVRD